MTSNSFILVVNKTLIGEFVSPLSVYGERADCRAYYCQRCGEVYAQRITQSNYKSLWHYIGGCCELCARNEVPWEFQVFRFPGEVDKGFEPIEILAAEFLFNCNLFGEIDERGSYTFR